MRERIHYVHRTVTRGGPREERLKGTVLGGASGWKSNRSTAPWCIWKCTISSTEENAHWYRRKHWLVGWFVFKEQKMETGDVGSTVRSVEPSYLDTWDWTLLNK